MANLEKLPTEWDLEKGYYPKKIEAKIIEDFNYKSG